MKRLELSYRRSYDSFIPSAVTGMQDWLGHLQALEHLSLSTPWHKQASLAVNFRDVVAGLRCMSLTSLQIKQSSSYRGDMQWLLSLCRQTLRRAYFARVTMFHDAGSAWQPVLEMLTKCPQLRVVELSDLRQESTDAYGKKVLLRLKWSGGTDEWRIRENTQGVLKELADYAALVPV